MVLYSKVVKSGWDLVDTLYNHVVKAKQTFQMLKLVIYFLFSSYFQALVVQFSHFSKLI